MFKEEEIVVPVGKDSVFGKSLLPLSESREAATFIYGMSWLSSSTKPAYMGIESSCLCHRSFSDPA